MTPTPDIEVSTETATTTTTIRAIDRAARRFSRTIPMSAMISAMTSRRLEMNQMSDHWMPAGRVKMPPAIGVTPPPARTGIRRPRR